MPRTGRILLRQTHNLHLSCRPGSQCSSSILRIICAFFAVDLYISENFTTFATDFLQACVSLICEPLFMQGRDMVLSWSQSLEFYALALNLHRSHSVALQNGQCRDLYSHGTTQSFLLLQVPVSCHYLMYDQSEESCQCTCNRRFLCQRYILMITTCCVSSA